MKHVSGLKNLNGELEGILLKEEDQRFRIIHREHAVHTLSMGYGALTLGVSDIEKKPGRAVNHENIRYTRSNDIG